MDSKVVKLNFKDLNPSFEELTVEKLRQLENRPDMPEQEAKEIILAIKMFVGIVLQVQFLKEQINKDIDHLNTAA